MDSLRTQSHEVEQQVIPNYSKQVKFVLTNLYGSTPEGHDDVYTVAEFNDLCKRGLFIDYDGFGYPVKDHMADETWVVKPSKRKHIPSDATHIVWFNR